VTFRTSDLAGLADDANQAKGFAKGFAMSVKITVFTGSFHDEAQGFSPARKGQGALAVWGLVLGSLLVGVATVAAVTVTAWVNGGAVVS
jgi:hypothetical protein